MKLSRFNEEQIISVPCGLKLALPIEGASADWSAP